MYLTNASTESLVNFFAKASAVANEDVYKAQNECVIARYALRDKVSVYTTLKDFIEEQAHKNPQQAITLLSQLDRAADNLLDAVAKITALLKRAAEIDVITSTRFDSVQLLHIVQQVPVIITSSICCILEIQLGVFLDTIAGDLNLNGQLDKFRSDIPLFAAAVAKEITAHLSDELNKKLCVLQPDSTTNSSNASAVTEDTIKSMINSVP